MAHANLIEPECYSPNRLTIGDKTFDDSSSYLSKSGGTLSRLRAARHAFAKPYRA
jgi:hypothetical protein